MAPVASRGMTTGPHVSFVPVVAPVAAVAAAPITAQPPSEIPTSENRSPITENRDPIADNRGPTADHRDPIGDDRLLTRDVAAANLAAIDNYQPMTDRGAMSLGQSYEHDSSITSKWWFWTAVGVGAAAIGGTSYYLIKHNHRGNTVSVQAAW
jgi:hypothetical protein